MQIDFLRPHEGARIIAWLFSVSSALSLSGSLSPPCVPWYLSFLHNICYLLETPLSLLSLSLSFWAISFSASVNARRASRPLNPHRHLFVWQFILGLGIVPGPRRAIFDFEFPVLR